MTSRTLSTVVGVVGAFFTSAFGGWDTALQALVVFMTVDYVSGLILAGIFHESTKTESGSLESGACRKGLIRKVMILLLVLIANYLDKIAGTTFVRDAVCIGFIVNEGISILENVGLMGIEYPEALKKALDVLNNKE